MENISTGDKVSIEQITTQINESDLVVLDFTASWCGPCQLMAPLIENLSQSLNHVKFFKIDVSDGDGADLSEEYEIGCLPTLCLLYQGELVNRNEGFNPKNDTLTELFSRYLFKYDTVSKLSYDSTYIKISLLLNPSPPEVKSPTEVESPAIGESSAEVTPEETPPLNTESDTESSE
jgi:thioredoxin 1